MKKSIALTIFTLVFACSLLLSSCSSAARESKKADTYADEVEAMNIFDSSIENAMPQTIGGVMVFQAFCDSDYTNEYSLHRAIHEAIEEKTE